MQKLWSQPLTNSKIQTLRKSHRNHAGLELLNKLVNKMFHLLPKEMGGKPHVWGAIFLFNSTNSIRAAAINTALRE